MPKIPLKVLVACEFSGVVREAFRRHGCNAWSCDIVPTDIPGKHIQKDALKILSDGWDLMISHPPCTHLACSGAAWFKDKITLQEEAIDFFLQLLNAPIPQICIENPVGVLSTRVVRPRQIIQPYEFGDAQRKTTCLWLKALPQLKGTCYVQPRIIMSSKGRPDPEWHTLTRSLPSEERRRVRSITFLGIAEAMADQWSNARDYCYRSHYGIRTPYNYTKTQRCKD